MNSTEHFIIRKLFRFEAAHRVRDAYSVRCRGLHGHSYRVEILLSGELDSVGMLLDFKRLKETIGKTIDVLIILYSFKIQMQNCYQSQVV